jgi:hypothetical protein
MMKPSPMDATVMGRPATKNEKPEAMMGTKGMVCKTMDKTMAGMPKTKGMDKAATDKAWMDWLQQSMMIPLSGNG